MARTDSERLDWLDKEHADLTWCMSFHPDRSNAWEVMTYKRSYRRSDLRVAIDAAMDAEEAGE